MSYSKVPQEEEIATTKSWDALRKEAKQYEYEIDSRLITFSQHKQEITQQELQNLLNNLTRATNEMGKYVDLSPSYFHLHSRHVSNLFEYNREFAKTKASVQHQKDHIELLQGGVYTRGTYQTQHARMEQTHEMVDEILQRAIDSQNDLERQHNELNSYSTRIKGVLNQFPAIRKVIKKIDTKQGKETLILGLLIGFCTCFLLWYMFR